MANTLNNNYRLEYTRYRHYFHRIWLISQTPQTKVSLALLLTIFTVIIFAVFAIKPTLITVAQLIKKIEVQEEVLAKLKQKAIALASAQQQYFSASTQIDQLYQAVPETYELQTLIRLIEATAAYHQVKLDSVSLGGVTYQNAEAPATDAQKNLSISISSGDSYEKVKAFVNDLANLQRLLLISNLGLTTGKGNQNADSQSEITFSVNSNAVYLPKSFTAAPPEVQPWDSLSMMLNT